MVASCKVDLVYRSILLSPLSKFQPGAGLGHFMNGTDYWQSYTYNEPF